MPLGWLQLRHKPLRLLVALSGWLAYYTRWDKWNMPLDYLSVLILGTGLVLVMFSAMRERIAQALAALTRRQREVFVLVHLEGYSVREAAELLERSPGTLKSHLHRALIALRCDLADLCEIADQGGKGRGDST